MRNKVPLKDNHAVFLRFCITGGIGFLVDFAILYLLLYMGIGPVIARIISASCALFCTWLINRYFTFRVTAMPSMKEMGRYLGMNGFGFLVNLGIYSFCVKIFRWEPAASLVIGSAAALMVNFIGNKKWVFKS